MNPIRQKTSHVPKPSLLTKPFGTQPGRRNWFFNTTPIRDAISGGRGW